MNKALEAITLLGNEKASIVFKDYLDDNFDIVADYVEQLPEYKNSGSIFDGVLPRQIRIGKFFSNIRKDEQRMRDLISGYVHNNQEHVAKFIHDHPIYKELHDKE